MKRPEARDQESIVSRLPGYETPKLSCEQAHLPIVWRCLGLGPALLWQQTALSLSLQPLDEFLTSRRAPRPRRLANPLPERGVGDPAVQCLAPRPGEAGGRTQGDGLRNGVNPKTETAS